MDESYENKQNEIGISDIFRVLLKKIRLLIIVFIIGGVVGGLFGFIRYKDEKYYGAEVKYEISIMATTYTYQANAVVDKKPANAPSYVYKQEHISMLLDHLGSEQFLAEILKEIYPSAVENVTVLKDGKQVIDLDSATVSEEAKNTFVTYLSWLKSAITFSFDHDVNPNAFSMLVSVKGDAEKASELLAAARTLVPEEVSGTVDEEGNVVKKGRIIVPDSSGTLNNDGSGIITRYTAECDPMTLIRSHRLNAGNTQKKTVLFAAIFALGALLVACVTVVVADRSDERLRDYDAFAKSVGIPVLGVIPSIDELADQMNTKQNSKGETDK
ncbi:MAG: hypothetical protein SPH68_00065 [Candidatus Borkfalkiaceae bacterium]|nr:hypothetical protein [Clostridia bacterium]MDY6222542.1 hypothetical protein [Christensenellaceae bacterium]